MKVDNKRDLIKDCLNKLNKLSDDSWESIADKYNLDYHPDNLRKLSYGFKIYSDALEEDNINNSNEELLVKIKKEKVKLQDIKTSVNKDIRELARREELIELFRNEINNLNENKPLVSARGESLEGLSNHAVAMLSDWHYGLEIDNNLNKFNTDICLKRVNELTDKIIKYSKSQNVGMIHLFFLGDLISGEIRNIIRLQNRIDISQQMIQVAEIVSEMINEIAKEIPYVMVNFALGNHERSISKKDDALQTDNYLPIIKEFVKLRVQNCNNVIINDNRYGDWVIVQNILGWTFVGSHGQNIKRNKGVYQADNILNVKTDYLCLGHYHQNETLTQYEAQVYINSSLCGSDEYSKSLMLHTFPSQKLLMVNKEGVFCEYLIKFRD